MNYSQEEKCWIWLATLDGVSTQTARSWVTSLGSAQAVRKTALLNASGLSPAPSEKTVSGFQRTANPAYPDRLADRLNQLGIQAVTPAHPDYSSLLAELDDAPILLYAVGDTSLLNCPDTIAMVGSRSSTDYGRKAAYGIAKELAGEGTVIVSAMDRGIGSCAVQGVLDGGGRAIAVLDSGVNVVDPSENKELYDRIAGQGLLLSEVPPGIGPQEANLPERDRIIAGLSAGLIVLEDGENGETRVIANQALDQGREVMAVPGNIDAPLSHMPNRLIREGCALITSGSDVIEAMGWSEPADDPGSDKPAGIRRSGREERITAAVPAKTDVPEEEPVHVTPGKLTPDEEAILGLLSMGQASFDEIVEALDFSAPRLGITLTIMEAKGLLNKLPGKIYERR